MAGSRDFITPAESDCLVNLETERNTSMQEIESIHHILWLNFQDSAHYTAALCKDRAVSNPSLVQYQFQQSAIAVTRLYKDSVDAVERAFELGQQHGKLSCRRDMATWAKRKKRKVNRLDLLRQLSRKTSSTTPLSSDNESSDDLSCVLSSLGVASPRPAAISPRGGPTLPEAAPSPPPYRPSAGSPPSTPPHSSTQPAYVSRKRKAESLFDEFLETVHSSKRNRQ